MAESNPVKVMHLIHSLEMGGAQKVIAYLAGHHDRSRYLPVVASLRRAGPLEGLFRDSGTEVVYFDKKSAFDAGCASRLRRYIRREGISLVNAHNFSASFWGRLAVMGLDDVAFIVTEHGRTGGVSPKLRWFNRLMSGGVDMIIAVSDETARFVGNVYPYNAHKVRTVVNGIDIPGDKGWDKARLESEFGIPQNARVIVNVASLTPVKDHALLIRAFGLVRGKNDEARLLIVGDGPLRAELEDVSRETGFAESIIFAGERVDGPDIIAACDVFCISSSAEGTSIAVLETMARGCPMVLTAVGGNVDLVRDGEDGLLVPHGQPVVLAGAIETILNDRELGMELSAAALRKLGADFSAAMMTRRTEAVYDEALGAIRKK